MKLPEDKSYPLGVTLGLVGVLLAYAGAFATGTLSSILLLLGLGCYLGLLTLVVLAFKDSLAEDASTFRAYMKDPRRGDRK
jgi:hypothetical protein